MFLSGTISLYIMNQIIMDNFNWLFKRLKFAITDSCIHPVDSLSISYKGRKEYIFPSFSN